MAFPTSYPVGTDLVTFMASLGLTITEDNANKYIASAIEQFEKRTHDPFIAQSGENFMEAEGGSSIDGYRYEMDDIPVLKTGVAVTWVPDSGDEVALTERTDYHFLPINAGVDRKPYKLLVLKTPKCAGRIKVEGLFGYTTQLPQSVWDAIIQKAAAMELNRIRVSQNSSQGGDGVKRVKSSVVEIEWFDQDGSHQSSFESFFQQVCEDYRY